MAASLAEVGTGWNFFRFRLESLEILSCLGCLLLANDVGFDQSCWCFRCRFQRRFIRVRVFVVWRGSSWFALPLSKDVTDDGYLCLDFVFVRVIYCLTLAFLG